MTAQEGFPSSTLLRDISSAKNTAAAASSNTGDSDDIDDMIDPLLTTLVVRQTDADASNSTTEASDDATPTTPSDCQAETDKGIKHISWNATSNSCSCDDGWQGPECSLCTTDDACISEDGDGSTCLLSNAITSDSKTKTYSCLLPESSPLIPFVGKRNFWGECNVADKKCEVNFAGSSPTEPHVSCDAMNCTMGSQVNEQGGIETQIQCPSTKCGPADGTEWPSAIPTFIRGPLSDRSATISIFCEPGDSAKCTVKIDEIPLPIDLICSFGDCMQANVGNGSSGNTTSLLEQEGGISKDNKSSSSYESLPIELIFLPILFFVLIIAIIALLLMIEAKKQYLRGVYARETKKVTGRARRIGEGEGVITPGSPEMYTIPDSATSESLPDIHMNIMSELSFTKIICDVSAAPDDESWLGTSQNTFHSSISHKVRQLNTGLKTSFRNVFLNSSTRNTAEGDPSSEKSSVEMASFDAVPEIPFILEKGNVDLDEDGVIYSPDESATTTPRRSEADSERSLDPTVQSKISAIGRKLHRTASKVKEAISSQLKRGRKRILHGITGSVYRGNMLAVMGPSGGGKSTFLNVLADENLQDARVKGIVNLDGKERQRWYRHITVYIPQCDELIPILTVRESIMYSGRLRLPWYTSKSKRLRKVNEVLDQLKIEHVGESMVGGSCGVRGISGGERRRVSIGMGLVADPKIMLLDEPTSGLDSSAAASIVSTLKELARKGDGRIVIASLHQPNHETFKELDILLLLAKGRQVYFGPAAEVEAYFAKCGFVCPKGLNIADYMLHIVSDLACLRDILTAEDEMTSIINLGGKEKRVEDEDEDDEDLKQSLDNLWQVEMYRPKTDELNVLIIRSFKQIWRRPMLLRLQLVLSLIASLFSIVMFRHMERNIAGIQNRLGFFFFQLAFFGFAGISSTDLILEERSIFLREIHGKFYSQITYFLSKVIVDGLMLRVLPMLIFDVLVYWSIGLREGAGHVLVFFVTTILFSLGTGALSVAVTLGSKTGGVASLGIILLLLFSILFGGFLSNAGSIPEWIGWCQYLSVYYQAMGAVVSNEVRGTTITTTLSRGLEITVNADDVLQKIQFAVQPNVASYIGALTLLYIGWVVAGYISMKVFFKVNG